MCRQCGCYHTPSSSQHAEIELPARPVPSDRSIPTRKELDKMKKDKAKRDTEAIRRGSIPSFGNNPWEKDLPKFFQMQDQERAEEEERQPVSRAACTPAACTPGSLHTGSAQTGSVSLNNRIT
ncbi:hypothetical protein XPA_009637 [Xanthoria parietina]